MSKLKDQRRSVIWHFSIGVAMLTLMTFQLFLGWMIKQNIESRLGSSKIYQIKKIHSRVGYIVYIFGKINIALGLHLYYSSFELLYIISLFYLIMAKLVIEFFYQFNVSLFPRKREQYSKIEIERSLSYSRIIDRLQSDQFRETIIKDFPKIRYILLREAVYDISDFQHPGGKFILEAIKGREIGRYIYGGYSLFNHKFLPHRHSEFAINYLETRYIGEYLNQSCPVLYQDEEEKNISTNRIIWKLIKTDCIYEKDKDQHQEGIDKKEIIEPPKIFTFQSDYYYVKQQFEGVKWLGKYFYIKPFGGGMVMAERPYSMVMCMTEQNMEVRQRIIDFFNFHMHGEGKNYRREEIYDEMVQISRTLQFLIKQIPKTNNLSKFIHKYSHKPYEITGPYGLGLQLEDDAKGSYYIICGGTGILPFLDLFDFLFKRYFYTILLNNKNKQIADNILLPGSTVQPSNIFKSDFRLYLAASFQSPDDFYGRNLVTDLFKLTDFSSDKQFDVIVRYQDKAYMDEHLPQTKSQFNSTFFGDWIKKKPQRIYICGSPKFEQNVYSALKINDQKAVVFI